MKVKTVLTVITPLAIILGMIGMTLDLQAVAALDSLPSRGIKRKSIMAPFFREEDACPFRLSSLGDA